MRVLGLGLEHSKIKRESLPSPRAEVGQENIAIVHGSVTPTQTMGTLCGRGRRAMKSTHRPHSQFMKGNAPSR